MTDSEVSINDRNAVELLIAILALVKGEIDLVQASMVGSILSNSEYLCW